MASWRSAAHAATLSLRPGRGLSRRGVRPLLTSVLSTSTPSYLDMQATTPVDPRVFDAMVPYFHGHFGNPHSRSHIYGWDAEDATENARAQLAALIGAQPTEVFFTSGATESNNMAIKGIAELYGHTKRHIITTQTEHKCVLAACRRLETEKGWDITYLPVNEDGLINLAELEAAIRPDTALVSVMLVNNEIGVVQPVEEIGRICRAHDVFFHTDAAQGAGKVPVDVKKIDCSLLSISAHKMYGPKGIGALYVRRKPEVRLAALIDGGGQERGIRSGTLATPIIVGFGAAAQVAAAEMSRDEQHIHRLARRLRSALQEKLPKVRLNGSATQRYCGNINMSFSCVEGETLLMSVGKAACASSGSACTSASVEPSYVLGAIGLDDDMAYASLRFGIGRFTTDEEVDRTIEHVVR
eukprot:TRINITY_DN3405_c0_g1_i1.p1 TRINITY_DN3405_c0_g1~~TRINITY_DN3405_c0_g1_i1.p1  ORF type:complete len:444 (-),score=97.81 TRINITY_DN3405_c0_g1_i1:542-1777(-)